MLKTLLSLLLAHHGIMSRATVCTILPNVEDKLVRIASGEWPPFIGSDLSNYGFVGEIITHALPSKVIKWNSSFTMGKSLC